MRFFSVLLVLAFFFPFNCFGGNTPLQLSSVTGDSQKIMRLLDGGSDINEDYRGNTPLMYAVISGHVDVVALLVKRGANLNLVNSFGQSALDLAIWQPVKSVAKKNYKKIEKMLRKASARTNTNIDKLPDTFRNLYLITTQGEIQTTNMHFEDVAGRIELRIFHLNDDGTEGEISDEDFVSRANYHKNQGRVSLSAQLRFAKNSKLTPMQKRCLPFYSKWNTFSLASVNMKGTTGNVWSLKSDDPRGICVYPTVEYSECTINGCLKYEAINIHITDNQKSAVKLAKKKQDQKFMTETERDSEMSRLVGNEGNKKSKHVPPKEYWEEGSCGDVSCTQQDIDFATQWMETW